MPKPKLTKPAKFPKKLHKKKGFKDPAVLYGTHMAPGDGVNVNGTSGRTPTGWVGTIATDNGDGSFDVKNLTVARVEKRKGKKLTAGGGTEDVSVTVTNTIATSDPVTTPSVPMIP